MKESFSGPRFDSLDELFVAVESFLGGLSANMLQKIFQELAHCKRGRESVE
jgi:hypothetical protein